jgi:aminotransferase
VSVDPSTFDLDLDAISRAITSRTRGIVVNTPHNPTGKVFTREELQAIAELCVEHDVVAITDEIYEHITYDGHPHVPMATLPEMRDRTVTIGALSKTYSVTGWRVGWAIASEPLMRGIRSTHDFLTVAAPTPFQVAGVTALGLPREVLERNAVAYAERRALLLDILSSTGFDAIAPAGAYYVMADVSPLGFGDDMAASRHLIEEIGIAAVPGSSFFSDPTLGRHLLRFAFCKRLETLEAAGERFDRLRREG